MTPDVFTQQLRTEILTAKFEAEAAAPAPEDSFTWLTPSTGQEEPFVFASVVGSMKKFKGHRTFQKFAADTYKIANEQYDNGFEANKTDVDDDKVGVYVLAARAMVERSKLLPRQLALEALADGETGLGFDKVSFFNTAHPIGGVKATGVGAGEGGGNVITVTGTGNADGLVHKFILVVNRGTGMIKPVIITERQSVTELQTDAGTPQAAKDMKYQYWVDARYGKGYGFWWDAVLVKITNLPTPTEMLAILGKAEVRLKSFVLAKENAADKDLAFHEALKPGPDTLTLVHGTELANLVRVVLNSENILQSGAAVTNMYRGFATPIASTYLTPAA